MYTRKEIVIKLSRIQIKLKRYKFKIWDAYRPRSVQENIYQSFWKKLKLKNSGKAIEIVK